MVLFLTPPPSRKKLLFIVMGSNRCILVRVHVCNDCSQLMFSEQTKCSHKSTRRDRQTDTRIPTDFLSVRPSQFILSLLMKKEEKKKSRNFIAPVKSLITLEPLIGTKKIQCHNVAPAPVHLSNLITCDPRPLPQELQPRKVVGRRKSANIPPFSPLRAKTHFFPPESRPDRAAIWCLMYEIH